MKGLFKNFMALWLFFLISPNAFAKCDLSTQQKAQKIKEILSHRDKPTLLNFTKVKEAKTYTLYQGSLTTSLSGTKILVPFDFYKSTNPHHSGPRANQKKKPLIVHLPGISGVNILDRHVGRFFAKRGKHVVISHYRDPGEKSPYKIYETTLNNILASLATIDHFSARSYVAKEKAALLAYSFGGIRASFLSAVDERIKAFKLVFPSASFAKTLAYSQLDTVLTLKKSFKSQLNITSDRDFIDYVNSELPYNPLKTFCKSDYSHYFIVHSNNDKYVPFKLQREFLYTLGNAASMKVDHLGHQYGISWYLLRHLSKANLFFDQIFQK